MKGYLMKGAVTIGLLGLVSGIWANTAAPPVLSPERYLQQVTNAHLGYQAARATQESLQGLRLEAKTPYQPRLMGGASIQFARNYGPMAQFTGADTTVQSFQVGLEGEWDNGVGYGVGYGLQYFGYSGSSFGIKPYYQASPYAQVMLPLWHNRGGQRTAQTIVSIKSQHDALHWQSTDQMNRLLAGAETIYWRLSMAKEALSLAEDGVGRAKKMVQWVRQRQQRGLADAADGAQTQALLKARELDVLVAQTEVQQLEREFNAARSLPASHPIESIHRLGEAIRSLQSPELTPESSALRATFAASDAELARLQSTILSGDPVLNLTGRVQLNPVQSGLGDMLTHSLSTDYPTVTVALQYASGLDLRTVAAIQAGYEKAKESNRLLREQAIKDRKHAITQLVMALKSAKDRLQDITELESLMQTKWQLESQRHGNGRSTLAQVLTAEQEYKQAAMQRLRVKADIVLTTIQLQQLGR